MERYGLIWHFVILFIYQLQCSLGFKNLTLLIEPGGSAVPANSSLLLECEARSDDPIRYRWRHAGHWLDSELYVTASPWTYLNGSLRIERVWLDTVGTYQCCAGTGDGILCSRNATVSVAWIGIPQVFPSSVEVEAGTSIRLLCRVEAELPGGFKIAWFRDGLSVAVGSQRITQLLAGSAILHITSASRGDSGQYSCRASNQYGASRTSIHTATVTVVDPTPAGQDQWGIKVPPSTTKAVVGSDAILECLLWREERMEVSWNRTDGKPIPWHRSSVLGLHNLLIRNVTVNESAIYRCQVEDTSSGQVDSASAALTVLGPPRFLSPMTDLVRSENAMVRIVCNVTGSPTPHVKWFHNGEEVTVPGRISMYHQPGGIAELHIWSSMPQDEGFYQCFATNDFGTVWSGMYYTLKLPETRPPVPTNLTVFVNDSTSVIVKWKQVMDPAVLSYSIYYYPTPDGPWASEVAHKTKYEKVLSHLRPYTNYTFQIKSFGRFGGSLPSSPVYAHTLEDIPTAAPDFWLTSSSPYSIDITWQTLPARESNGVVNKYKICYQVELSERRFTCFEVSTAVPHLLLNNLEAGTEYGIKMAAATHVGFGPYSQWAIIRTMAIENCTGPDTLRVVPIVVNSTTVEVTWSLPASTTASTPGPEGQTGLLGFKLTLTALRDRSQQMRVFPVHARSTILGNLEPAMAYNLVMQGYSHCGEGHVTGVTFQLPQATDGQNRPILLAPFDLRGSAISATAITLQWQRPHTAFQVDFYMVYGEPSRKAYSRSFEQRSTICAATIRDLTPFTEYVLSVKAFGGDMESAYSHQIYLKTLEDVPSEPIHFSVVPFNGLDVTTVVKVKWQPPHSPNGVIVEYQVSYSAINRTQLDPARQIVSTNGTTHQVVVYNLKAGYHYIFRVKAFTSVGGGASSTPVLYVVKEHPMTTGTPLDRPFDGLGGELEKGIVAGIILATICIMICTLLLVVRHRRDCRHQFCVTDKEGSQANHMEMVGQGRSPYLQIYHPLPQHAGHQHIHSTAEEDPKSQEPLLNGHGPLPPHNRYLKTTLPTSVTAAASTSCHSTHPEEPQQQHQDSTLPQPGICRQESGSVPVHLHHMQSPPPQQQHQQQQQGAEKPPCPPDQLAGGSRQETISRLLSLLADNDHDSGAHHCLVHAHSTANSSCDSDGQAYAPPGGPSAQGESGTSSPPHPSSYHGTSSDSGMDGDMDWDVGDGAVPEFLNMVAPEGHSVDPSVYLSCNTDCCSNQDTSPDLISNALYLGSANVSHT